MRLKEYKKLKAVLDADDAKMHHDYSFTGTRTITKSASNGRDVASYRISLYPDTEFGAIHNLPYLMKRINEASNSASAFMASHIHYTPAPSKAKHYICVC